MNSTKILQQYRKTVITALIMASTCVAIIIGAIFFRIDVFVFEDTVQILVLIFGLLYAFSYESKGSVANLKNNLLITLIYTLLIGEFIQIIYPGSEVRTIGEGLIIDLTHNHLLLIGLALTAMKFGYDKDTGWNIRVGLAFIAINLYWLWTWIELYYQYNFGNKLYMYMQPEWVIFLSIAVGLIGIIIGALILARSLTLRAGVVFSSLWVIGEMALFVWAWLF